VCGVCVCGVCMSVCVTLHSHIHFRSVLRHCEQPELCVLCFMMMMMMMAM